MNEDYDTGTLFWKDLGCDMAGDVEAERLDEYGMKTIMVVEA